MNANQRVVAICVGLNFFFVITSVQGVGALSDGNATSTLRENGQRSPSWNELVTTYIPETGRGQKDKESTPQNAIRMVITEHSMRWSRRDDGQERMVTSQEIEAQTSVDVVDPTTDGIKTPCNDGIDVEPTVSMGVKLFDQTEMSWTVNTSTLSNGNVTEEAAPVSGVETWAIVLDQCQLALTCIGYVANKVTFITLVKNGHMFSPAICLLLKHQALLDSWVSAMGTILLLQPPLWKTGRYGFDLVVCYVWHSQAIYWATIYMSVWNLVAIAVERYIAVCHPFKHNDFQGTPVRVIVASMYIASVIILFPSYIQVRFKDNMCISEYLIPGKFGEDFFYGYSILCLFTLYLLPALAFMFLYGRIVTSLRQHKKSHSGTSKALKRVQATITKTAFVVTLVFMVTIGFDAWSYTLGYTGVTNYEFGTPVQKIGVFFAVCNSVINPFVYLLLMPAFRDSLAMTFCCRNTSEEGTSNSVTRSSDDNIV